MSKYFISVIMPIYNAEKYVKKVAIVQDGLTGMMIKFILEEKDGDKNGMECNGCVEPEHTGSSH